MEQRLYSLKQSVQDRPNFVLSHRMLVERPGYAALAKRQCSIGHSHNAVEIVRGALTVEAGRVVYTSRGPVGQIAGMTGRVARPMASGPLSECLWQRFESLPTRTR